MPKHAISVTLEAENLTWLKGRVGAGSNRSVSDLLDQLVTAARTSGHLAPPRSVVGTIDIDDGDPELEDADAAVQTMFDVSLARPALVRDGRPRYGVSRRVAKRRG
jgi:hypothetical protein